MPKLRINPLVATDLKEIRDHLQGRRRVCRDLSCGQPISGYYENL